MKQKKKASYDKPATIVGKESVLELAMLKTKDTVQINGKFYGDMVVEGSIIVSETGYVKGNIEAEFLLVAGHVDGNVDVSGQLHLTKSCNITGDIKTASIVIDEGAVLKGNCDMSDVQKYNKPVEVNKEPKDKK
ncbi:MAG: polymer-forming cytoskeletal protein [Vallitalea sp.]|nr:polymer-forming cytoskeletal protein [Vallitalea sp.]